MWVLAALIGCEARVAPVDDACPPLTEGVEIAVGEIRDGMNLTFTTETGDVAELRGRVTNLARLYEATSGDVESGMPAVVTVVSPLATGARLRVDAVHMYETEIVQQHVRQDVEGLLRGECPAMVPIPDDVEPARGMRRSISGET